MNLAKTVWVAYVYLLAGLPMSLRATKDGQELLSDLRDQVAALTGQEPEDVQNEAEFQAWKLANGG